VDLDIQIAFIKNMDLDYKSDPNIWIWIEFGLDYPKLNP